MTGSVRIRALVSGAVQGVGFRYHATQRAIELGVSGFVRNLPDGRVEVEAEGSHESVDALVSWLATGPEWADVTDVETARLEPAGGTGFETLH